MFTLLSSGQTGVERGAMRAAIALGIPVQGVCEARRIDEWGPLPAEIGALLTPCSVQGPQAAVSANLERATAVLFVLPRREMAGRTPSVAAVRRKVKKRELPFFIADPMTDVAEARTWLREATVGSASLLVTGPRQTRWPDGERAGWRIVSELASHP